MIYVKTSRAYTIVDEPYSIPNGYFAEILSSVIERGVPFRFQASGMSMSPFVRSGDVLTISPVDGSLKLGEVVAFRHPAGGGFAVHRVIKMGSHGLLIQGDNCAEPDGWMAPDAILGRVTRIERAGREIRLGLGVERFIIAALSQVGLMIPLVAPVRWAYHRLVKGGVL